MLNTQYLKLLKLLSVVLLATVFIMSFTKNVSYAYTFEEFVGYVNEHKEEMTSSMQNRWNYIITYFDLDTLSSYWQDSNAVTMYMIFDTSGYTMKTVQFRFLYYDNDNGRLYNSNGNLNIENKTQDIGTLKVDYNNYNNTTEYTTGTLSTSNIASTQMFNSNNSNNNRTMVIVKDRDIYTASIGDTVVTGYNFINNYIPVNGPQFIKVQNYLNYNNRWHNLGRIEGDDLSLWRVRAELFDNDFNLIGSWHMISNEENGLNVSFNNYNYEDNNIYLYALTSYLYTNKTYYLYLFYDNDDNLAWEEVYNFTLSSGDIGYTSQNATNDIIQNQNQNTQDVINTITNSGDFNGVMIGSLGLSGDITSGDTDSIAGQLGYEQRANPWQDFINRMLYDIGDVLMNNEDVDYTLGFHNNHSLTLHSKDFVLPDGPIKLFLNICLTYFIVVILYQEMKKIIN